MTRETGGARRQPGADSEREQPDPAAEVQQSREDDRVHIGDVRLRDRRARAEERRGAEGGGDGLQAEATVTYGV